MFSLSKGDVFEPFADWIFFIFKILFKSLSRIRTQNGELPDWLVWLVLVLIGTAAVIYIARLCSKKSSK